MRKLQRLLTSKTFVFIVAILIQFIVLTWALFTLAHSFEIVYSILVVLSVILIIYMANREVNASYKIAWMVPMAIFPVVGGIFYLLFGNKKLPKKVTNHHLAVVKELSSLRTDNSHDVADLKYINMDAYKQAKYLYEQAGFTLYKGTETTYLEIGEVYHEHLKEELKKAEKFIFIEYFIIAEGSMWNEILEILTAKVKEGVEVRIIYDDAGSLPTLPRNYHKYLESLGFKVLVFNKLEPALLIHMNHRDHRKIVSIDSKVAFTGGVNLADEYVNRKVRFGHWQDSGIMVKGEGAWDFTLMFIQFWNTQSKKDQFEDPAMYKPEHVTTHGHGYMLPYADTPLDNEVVGENAHINMINMAKEFVYIKTPYLICDNEVINALQLAAKSGVRVNMILPHIPDKWYVHIVSRAYYPPLLKAGVHIYEYTPGFIHSKEVIADGKFAIIGTTNMDYRSYYLHYECGTWLYDTKSVEDMTAAYHKTLEDCEEIQYDYFEKEKLPVKLMRAILRLFAPLL